MSAYIVDRAHIDLLVWLGLDGPAGPRVLGEGRMRWFVEDPASTEWSELTLRKLNHETADEVGRMLWFENFRSVDNRYPDGDDLPGPLEPVEALTYTYRRSGPATLVEGLKAVDCYEYQSCEHEGWRSSEAKRFCEALRGALIEALPGYAEAPWGWKQGARTARGTL